jgi:homoserine kinase type II
VIREMLWEPDDPGQALEERFGFPDAEAAARWVTDTLDEHWGVRVDSCERIVMSSGNALAWVGTPGGPLIAKWSVVPWLFSRLAEVARLTDWLDRRGLPVSAPVPARDDRLRVETGGVSIGVQRVIDGDLLDTADLGQVRAAGVMLARLQEELAKYPSDALAEASEPLPRRITGWLDDQAGHLPAAARDTLRGMVAGAPPDPLPRQLVHFDFRAANLLYAGDEVTAILDFEEARLDHRLVELARAATLLGTRYRDWGPVPPEVRTEFLAGYRAVCPLTPAEASWLKVLLLWQAMAMVPEGDDPTGWGPSAWSLADAS